MSIDLILKRAIFVDEQLRILGGQPPSSSHSPSSAAANNSDNNANGITIASSANFLRSIVESTCGIDEYLREINAATTPSGGSNGKSRGDNTAATATAASGVHQLFQRPAGYAQSPSVLEVNPQHATSSPASTLSAVTASASLPFLDRSAILTIASREGVSAAKIMLVSAEGQQLLQLLETFVMTMRSGNSGGSNSNASPSRTSSASQQQRSSSATKRSAAAASSSPRRNSNSTHNASTTPSSASSSSAPSLLDFSPLVSEGAITQSIRDERIRTKRSRSASRERRQMTTSDRDTVAANQNDADDKDGGSFANDTNMNNNSSDAATPEKQRPKTGQHQQTSGNPNSTTNTNNVNPTRINRHQHQAMLLQTLLKPSAMPFYTLDEHADTAALLDKSLEDILTMGRRRGGRGRNVNKTREADTNMRSGSDNDYYSDSSSSSLSSFSSSSSSDANNQRRRSHSTPTKAKNNKYEFYYGNVDNVAGKPPPRRRTLSNSGASPPSEGSPKSPGKRQQGGEGATASSRRRRGGGRRSELSLKTLSPLLLLPLSLSDIVTRILAFVVDHVCPSHYVGWSQLQNMREKRFIGGVGSNMNAHRTTRASANTTPRVVGNASSPSSQPLTTQPSLDRDRDAITVNAHHTAVAAAGSSTRINLGSSSSSVLPPTSGSNSPPATSPNQPPLALAGNGNGAGAGVAWNRHTQLISSHNHAIQVNTMLQQANAVANNNGGGANTFATAPSSSSLSSASPFSILSSDYLANSQKVLHSYVLILIDLIHLLSHERQLWFDALVKRSALTTTTSAITPSSASSASSSASVAATLALGTTFNDSLATRILRSVSDSVQPCVKMTENNNTQQRQADDDEVDGDNCQARRQLSPSPSSVGSGVGVGAVVALRHVEDALNKYIRIVHGAFTALEQSYSSLANEQKNVVKRKENANSSSNVNSSVFVNASGALTSLNPRPRPQSGTPSSAAVAVNSGGASTTMNNSFSSSSSSALSSKLKAKTRLVCETALHQYRCAVAGFLMTVAKTVKRVSAMPSAYQQLLEKRRKSIEKRLYQLEAQNRKLLKRQQEEKERLSQGKPARRRKSSFASRQQQHDDDASKHHHHHLLYPLLLSPPYVAAVLKGYTNALQSLTTCMMDHLTNQHHTLLKALWVQQSPSIAVIPAEGIILVGNNNNNKQQQVLGASSMPSSVPSSSAAPVELVALCTQDVPELLETPFILTRNQRKALALALEKFNASQRHDNDDSSNGNDDGFVVGKTTAAPSLSASSATSTASTALFDRLGSILALDDSYVSKSDTNSSSNNNHLMTTATTTAAVGISTSAAAAGSSISGVGGNVSSTPPLRRASTLLPTATTAAPSSTAASNQKSNGGGGEEGRQQHTIENYFRYLWTSLAKDPSVFDDRSGTSRQQKGDASSPPRRTNNNNAARSNGGDGTMSMMMLTPRQRLRKSKRDLSISAWSHNDNQEENDGDYDGANETDVFTLGGGVKHFHSAQDRSGSKTSLARARLRAGWQFSTRIRYAYASSYFDNIYESGGEGAGGTSPHNNTYRYPQYNPTSTSTSASASSPSPSRAQSAPARSPNAGSARRQAAAQLVAKQQAASAAAPNTAEQTPLTAPPPPPLQGSSDAAVGAAPFEKENADNEGNSKPRQQQLPKQTRYRNHVLALAVALQQWEEYVKASGSVAIDPLPTTAALTDRYISMETKEMELSAIMAMEDGTKAGDGKKGNPFSAGAAAATNNNNHNDNWTKSRPITSQPSTIQGYEQQRQQPLVASPLPQPLTPLTTATVGRGTTTSSSSNSNAHHHHHGPIILPPTASSGTTSTLLSGWKSLASGGSGSVGAAVNTSVGGGGGGGGFLLMNNSSSSSSASAAVSSASTKHSPAGKGQRQKLRALQMIQRETLETLFHQGGSGSGSGVGGQQKKRKGSDASNTANNGGSAVVISLPRPSSATQRDGLRPYGHSAALESQNARHTLMATAAAAKAKPSPLSPSPNQGGEKSLRNDDDDDNDGGIVEEEDYERRARADTVAPERHDDDGNDDDVLEATARSAKSNRDNSVHVILSAKSSFVRKNSLQSLNSIQQQQQQHMSRRPSAKNLTAVNPNATEEVLMATKREDGGQQQQAEEATHYFTPDEAQCVIAAFARRFVLNGKGSDKQRRKYLRLSEKPHSPPSTGDDDEEEEVDPSSNSKTKSTTARLLQKEKEELHALKHFDVQGGNAYALKMQKEALARLEAKAAEEQARDHAVRTIQRWVRTVVGSMYATCPLSSHASSHHGASSTTPSSSPATTANHNHVVTITSPTSAGAAVAFSLGRPLAPSPSQQQQQVPLSSSASPCSPPSCGGMMLCGCHGRTPSSLANLVEMIDFYAKIKQTHDQQQLLSLRASANRPQSALKNPRKITPPPATAEASSSSATAASNGEEKSRCDGLVAYTRDGKKDVENTLICLLFCPADMLKRKEERRESGGDGEANESSSMSTTKDITTTSPSRHARPTSAANKSVRFNDSTMIVASAGTNNNSNINNGPFENDFPNSNNGSRITSPIIMTSSGPPPPLRPPHLHLVREAKAIRRFLAKIKVMRIAARTIESWWWRQGNKGERERRAMVAQRIREEAVAIATSTRHYYHYYLFPREYLLSLSPLFTRENDARKHEKALAAIELLQRVGRGFLVRSAPRGEQDYYCYCHLLMVPVSPPIPMVMQLGESTQHEMVASRPPCSPRVAIVASVGSNQQHGGSGQFSLFVPPSPQQQQQQVVSSASSNANAISTNNSYHNNNNNSGGGSNYNSLLRIAQSNQLQQLLKVLRAMAEHRAVKGCTSKEMARSLVGGEVSSSSSSSKASSVFLLCRSRVPILNRPKPSMFVPAEVSSSSSAHHKNGEQLISSEQRVQSSKLGTAKSTPATSVINKSTTAAAGATMILMGVSTTRENSKTIDSGHGTVMSGVDAHSHDHSSVNVSGDLLHSNTAQSHSPLSKQLLKSICGSAFAYPYIPKPPHTHAELVVGAGRDSGSNTTTAHPFAHSPSSDRDHQILPSSSTIARWGESHGAADIVVGITHKRQFHYHQAVMGTARGSGNSDDAKAFHSPQQHQLNNTYLNNNSNSNSNTRQKQQQQQHFSAHPSKAIAAAAATTMAALNSGGNASVALTAIASSSLPPLPPPTIVNLPSMLHTFVDTRGAGTANKNSSASPERPSSPPPPLHSTMPLSVAATSTVPSSSASTSAAVSRGGGGEDVAIISDAMGLVSVASYPHALDSILHPRTTTAANGVNKLGAMTSSLPPLMGPTSPTSALFSAALNSNSTAANHKVAGGGVTNDHRQTAPSPSHQHQHKSEYNTTHESNSGDESHSLLLMELSENFHCAYYYQIFEVPPSLLKMHEQIIAASPSHQQQQTQQLEHVPRAPAAFSSLLSLRHYRKVQYASDCASRAARRWLAVFRFRKQRAVVTAQLQAIAALDQRHVAVIKIQKVVRGFIDRRRNQQQRKQYEIMANALYAFSAQNRRLSISNKNDTGNADNVDGDGKANENGNNNKTTYIPTHLAKAAKKILYFYRQSLARQTAQIRFVRRHLFPSELTSSSSVASPSGRHATLSIQNSFDVNAVAERILNVFYSLKPSPTDKLFYCHHSLPFGNEDQPQQQKHEVEGEEDDDETARNLFYNELIQKRSLAYHYRAPSWKFAFSQTFAAQYNNAAGEEEDEPIDLSAFDKGGKGEDDDNNDNQQRQQAERNSERVEANKQKIKTNKQFQRSRVADVIRGMCHDYEVYLADRVLRRVSDGGDSGRNHKSSSRRKEAQVVSPNTFYKDADEDDSYVIKRGGKHHVEIAGGEYQSSLSSSSSSSSSSLLSDSRPHDKQYQFFMYDTINPIPRAFSVSCSPERDDSMANDQRGINDNNDEERTRRKSQGKSAKGSNLLQAPSPAPQQYKQHPLDAVPILVLDNALSLPLNTAPIANSVPSIEAAKERDRRIFAAVTIQRSFVRGIMRAKKLVAMLRAEKKREEAYARSVLEARHRAEEKRSVGELFRTMMQKNSQKLTDDVISKRVGTALTLGAAPTAATNGGISPSNLNVDSFDFDHPHLGVGGVGGGASNAALDELLVPNTPTHKHHTTVTYCSTNKRPAMFPQPPLHPHHSSSNNVGATAAQDLATTEMMRRHLQRIKRLDHQRAVPNLELAKHKISNYANDDEKDIIDHHLDERVVRGQRKPATNAATVTPATIITTVPANTMTNATSALHNKPSASSSADFISVGASNTDETTAPPPAMRGAFSSSTSNDHSHDTNSYQNNTSTNNAALLSEHAASRATAVNSCSSNNAFAGSGVAVPPPPPATATTITITSLYHQLHEGGGGGVAGGGGVEDDHDGRSLLTAATSGYVRARGANNQRYLPTVDDISILAATADEADGRDNNNINTISRNNAVSTNGLDMTAAGSVPHKGRVVAFVMADREEVPPLASSSSSSSSSDGQNAENSTERGQVKEEIEAAVAAAEGEEQPAAAEGEEEEEEEEEDSRPMLLRLASHLATHCNPLLLYWLRMLCGDEGDRWSNLVRKQQKVHEHLDELRLEQLKIWRKMVRQRVVEARKVKRKEDRIRRIYLRDRAQQEKSRQRVAAQQASDKQQQQTNAATMLLLPPVANGTSQMTNSGNNNSAAVNGTATLTKLKIFSGSTLELSAMGGNVPTPQSTPPTSAVTTPLLGSQQPPAMASLVGSGLIGASLLSGGGGKDLATPLKPNDAFTDNNNNIVNNTIAPLIDLSPISPEMPNNQNDNDPPTFKTFGVTPIRNGSNANLLGAGGGGGGLGVRKASTANSGAAATTISISYNASVTPTPGMGAAANASVTTNNNASPSELKRKASIEQRKQQRLTEKRAKQRASMIASLQNFPLLPKIERINLLPPLSPRKNELVMYYSVPMSKAMVEIHANHLELERLMYGRGADGEEDEDEEDSNEDDYFDSDDDDEEEEEAGRSKEGCDDNENGNAPPPRKRSSASSASRRNKKRNASAATASSNNNEEEDDGADVVSAMGDDDDDEDNDDTVEIDDPGYDEEEGEERNDDNDEAISSSSNDDDDKDECEIPNSSDEDNDNHHPLAANSSSNSPSKQHQSYQHPPRPVSRLGGGYQQQRSRPTSANLCRPTSGTSTPHARHQQSADLMSFDSGEDGGTTTTAVSIGAGVVGGGVVERERKRGGSSMYDGSAAAGSGYEPVYRGRPLLQQHNTSNANTNANNASANDASHPTPPSQHLLESSQHQRPHSRHHSFGGESHHQHHGNERGLGASSLVAALTSMSSAATSIGLVGGDKAFNSNSMSLVGGNSTIIPHLAGGNNTTASGSLITTNGGIIIDAEELAEGIQLAHMNIRPKSPTNMNATANNVVNHTTTPQHVAHMESSNNVNNGGGFIPQNSLHLQHPLTSGSSVAAAANFKPITQVGGGTSSAVGRAATTTMAAQPASSSASSAYSLGGVAQIRVGNNNHFDSSSNNSNQKTCAFAENSSSCEQAASAHPTTSKTDTMAFATAMTSSTSNASCFGTSKCADGGEKRRDSGAESDSNSGAQKKVAAPSSSSVAEHKTEKADTNVLHPQRHSISDDKNNSKNVKWVSLSPATDLNVIAVATATNLHDTHDASAAADGNHRSLHIEETSDSHCPCRKRFNNHNHNVNNNKHANTWPFSSDNDAANNASDEDSSATNSGDTQSNRRRRAREKEGRRRIAAAANTQRERAFKNQQAQLSAEVAKATIGPEVISRVYRHFFQKQSANKLQIISKYGKNVGKKRSIASGYSRLKGEGYNSEASSSETTSDTGADYFNNDDSFNQSITTSQLMKREAATHRVEESDSDSGVDIIRVYDDINGDTNNNGTEETQMKLAHRIFLQIREDAKGGIPRSSAALGPPDRCCHLYRERRRANINARIRTRVQRVRKAKQMCLENSINVIRRTTSMASITTTPTANRGLLASQQQQAFFGGIHNNGSFYGSNSPQFAASRALLGGGGGYGSFSNLHGAALLQSSNNLSSLLFGQSITAANASIGGREYFYGNNAITPTAHALYQMQRQQNQVFGRASQSFNNLQDLITLGTAGIGVSPLTPDAMNFLSGPSSSSSAAAASQPNQHRSANAAAAVARALSGVTHWYTQQQLKLQVAREALERELDDLYNQRARMEGIARLYSDSPFPTPDTVWSNAAHLAKLFLESAAVHAWRNIFSHTSYDQYKQNVVAKTPAEKDERMRRVLQRNLCMLGCYRSESEEKWIQDVSVDITKAAEIYKPAKSDEGERQTQVLEQLQQLLANGSYEVGSPEYELLMEQIRDAETFVNNEETRRVESFYFTYDFVCQCFPALKGDLSYMAEYLLSQGIQRRLVEVLSGGNMDDDSDDEKDKRKKRKSYGIDGFGSFVPKRSHARRNRKNNMVDEEDSTTASSADESDEDDDTLTESLNLSNRSRRASSSRAPDDAAPDSCADGNEEEICDEEAEAMKLLAAMTSPKLHAHSHNDDEDDSFSMLPPLDGDEGDELMPIHGSDTHSPTSAATNMMMGVTPAPTVPFSSSFMRGGGALMLDSGLASASRNNVIVGGEKDNAKLPTDDSTETSVINNPPTVTAAAAPSATTSQSPQASTTMKQKQRSNRSRSSDGGTKLSGRRQKQSPRRSTSCADVNGRDAFVKWFALWSGIDFAWDIQDPKIFDALSTAATTPRRNQGNRSQLGVSDNSNNQSFSDSSSTTTSSCPESDYSNASEALDVKQKSKKRLFKLIRKSQKREEEILKVEQQQICRLKPGDMMCSGADNNDDSLAKIKNRRKLQRKIQKVIPQLPRPKRITKIARAVTDMLLMPPQQGSWSNRTLTANISPTDADEDNDATNPRRNTVKRVNSLFPQPQQRRATRIPFEPEPSNPAK